MPFPYWCTCNSHWTYSVKRSLHSTFVSHVSACERLGNLNAIRSRLGIEEVGKTNVKKSELDKWQCCTGHQTRTGRYNYKTPINTYFGKRNNDI